MSVGISMYRKFLVALCAAAVCGLLFGFWLGRIETAPTDANSSEERSIEREIETRGVLAQETTAIWTRWMGVFTAVGIVLLWLTLKEASNTTKAAQSTVVETRRIGEAQSRAYISLKSLTVFKKTIDESTFSIYIEPIIVNSGSSTANFVASEGLYFYGSEREFLDAEGAHSGGSLATLGPTISFNAGKFIDGRYNDKFLDGAHEKGRTFWYRGIIRYQDIFSTKWELRLSYKLADPRVLKESTSTGMQATPYGNGLIRLNPSASQRSP